MRKIFGDGLRLVNPDKVKDDDISPIQGSIFLLGPSDRPYAVYASETILEVEIENGDKYFVPVKNVIEMLKREKLI